ncbi:DGQHR domain-containing protein [Salinicola avicenniae]|uniref:DGQHR domain-containing protein n=1 Tax=Salinicola avicenniae TaxID=2916836 RepID=UPI002072EBA4|nr:MULTISPECIES: DGQHR domain-containing protein [unclassified Salinicola]
MVDTIKVKAIEVAQREQSFYLANIKAKHLSAVSYVSVRGQDSEPGAVQRYLNPRRIAGIKEYTQLQGNFPAALVLNWVCEEHEIVFDNDEIEIPLVERSAQLIDGQHRLSGIKEAIKEDEAIAELELPVSIYIGLNTKQCANIFLSINTEQKPVPRSLVYDLYSVADDEIVDPAAARARDIVDALNNEEDSPYYQEIKVPGTPRRKGGIALSTAVTAIKPIVESNGIFEQVGIEIFEQQRNVIKNFFTVISDAYGEEWADKTNAFMYASGFLGAIEFLNLRVIPYCNSMGGNYTKEFIAGIIRMDRDNLIYQSEVKGIQGKEAPRIVYKRLDGMFETNAENKTILT